MGLIALFFIFRIFDLLISRENTVCPCLILAAELIGFPKLCFIPVLILSAPAPAAKGFSLKI